eukprot:Gregarina_sp_Poly_1__771@NODE_1184_length_4843_cov_219_562814_g814_i0_p6_GENE_NODE_1184_length_4843_cov_219_562814_g814_i0NODE_1184_length_4843_cov_219_562814_g814_i0_p6_ORF_typecomplete_len113_score8_08_NODE_1184_length_4843_cov_219_562814_g814_i020372375
MSKKPIYDRRTSIYDRTPPRSHIPTHLLTDLIGCRGVTRCNDLLNKSDNSFALSIKSIATPSVNSPTMEADSRVINGIFMRPSKIGSSRHCFVSQLLPRGSVPVAVLDMRLL